MLAAILSAAALHPAAGSAAAPELATLLPRQAEIFLPAAAEPRAEGALARLVLLPEVLELSNPDLSDLRIFDRQGREVPYLLHQERAPENLEAVALLRRPALVFPALPAADGGAAGVLRFGARRVRAPRYDLEELLPAVGTAQTGAAARLAIAVHDPQGLISARLGPVTLNPGFDPTPALAFALHPGAALDPRRFSHRRRLTVPTAAEGLHHLRLTLEDLARARPDLADLRVADGEGWQWAYLLEPRADHLVRPLAVEGPATREGVSRYRLALPARPAALDRLLLDCELPFFDRAYELRGRAPGEAEMEVLSRGRLSRDLGDPRPVSIPLTPRRLEELELEVRDGDDAPLAWSRIEARFPLPEIYFAAPEGSYELLLGSPREEPPSYELARVRSVVLSVESTEVEAGPLEPNPAYRAAVRWTSSEGLQRLLLWGAVLFAVVFLTVLTLRLARGEGEAG